MSDIESDANNPEPPARDRADAERLAKTIALQFEREHQAASSPLGGRAGFRIWSLVIILGFLLASLFALDWMLSQIQRPNRHTPPAAAATPADSHFPEKQ